MGLVSNNTKEVLTLDKMFERDLLALVEDAGIPSLRRLEMIRDLREAIKSFAWEYDNPWHCPVECQEVRAGSEDAYICVRKREANARYEYIDLYTYSIGLGCIHSDEPHVTVHGSAHSDACKAVNPRFKFSNGDLVRRFMYDTDMILWKIPKDCPLYPPVIQALEKIYQHRM